MGGYPAPSLVAGLVLLALSACTSVPPAAQIPESITTARTASDHQRIADYFARKAASYEAEAVLHEKMGRSYGGRPRGDPATWAAHCRSLQQRFAAAAQDARALEQAHRQLAAAASR